MGRESWGVPIEGGFFDEIRHLYRKPDGCIVPSTTQVFDVLGLNDFSKIDEKVLLWKREYGLALHKGFELLTLGSLDWDTVDDRLIEPLTGIECFLKGLEYTSLSAEEKRIHTVCGMSYGLTTDGTGEITYHGRRRHVILDLKSGSKFSPCWKWQNGGYALAQPTVDGGWLGLVIQVDPEGKVVPFWIDLLSAKREFQLLLATCNLVLNNGLAKIG